MIHPSAPETAQPAISLPKVLLAFEAMVRERIPERHLLDILKHAHQLDALHPAFWTAVRLGPEAVERDQAVPVHRVRLRLQSGRQPNRPFRLP